MRDHHSVVTVTVTIGVIAIESTVTMVSAGASIQTTTIGVTAEVAAVVAVTTCRIAAGT